MAGLWLFRNVTKAYDFEPSIESLSIVNDQPCALATLSLRYQDTAGTVAFDNEDELTVRFDGTLIFGGDVSLDTPSDTTAEIAPAIAYGVPRIYSLTARDYTNRLEDNLVRKNRRRRETVQARVLWIMGFSNRGITATSSTVLQPTSGPRWVDPHDYRGMTVREALEHAAGAVNASFWVDFSKVLHFVRPGVNYTAPAPFILARPYVGTAGTAPYTGFVMPQDSKDLANAVRVKGTGVRRWRKNDASITLYGRQERNFDDPSIRTRSMARKVGDNFLALHKQPIRQGSLTCPRPGLEALQWARIVNPEWSIDEDFVITTTRLSYVNPIEMTVQVDFSDRVVPCYQKRSTAGRLVQQVNDQARELTRLSGGGGGAAVPVATTSLGLGGSALACGDGSYGPTGADYVMPEDPSFDFLGGALWQGIIPANIDPATCSITMSGNIVLTGGQPLETVCGAVFSRVFGTGGESSGDEGVQMDSGGCVWGDDGIVPISGTYSDGLLTFGGAVAAYDRRIVVYVKRSGGSAPAENISVSYSGTLSATGFTCDPTEDVVYAYSGEVLGPALGEPVV